ncbi:MAG TPA: plastocyanin/azurin family copper-binding protein [Thermoleophilaceae bacterium]|nr:plastocyanin/azurin family copper-binding protein [Thermoleophilaceae bacterium]
MRHLALLGAGMLLAFSVARFPALAADQSIAAVDASPSYKWDQTDVTIAVGEKVTWTNNTSSGSHNVCVRRSNVASGCGEYTSGSPTSTWPAEGYSHQFPSDGTFTFRCQVHASMTGTLVVGTGENPPVDTGTGTSTGTGTGTSTTPPTYSQPTDTTTVPTQKQTTTVVTDTTAPSFSAKPKRRASRTALIVTFTASEDATLKASVYRRPPRGRSFGRVSRRSLQVKLGKNLVTLIRKLGKRRAGAYRVKLQLVDAAGNKSAARTISFKIA